MKALVLTGSRADANCQDMVYQALNEAGHQAALVPFHSMGEGTPVMRDQAVYSAVNVVEKLKPDVVVVAGDRIEMLKMTIYFAELGLPICHISGGDVTEGSADNRYRDAITALSCIHCAETDIAFNRLTGGDYIEGPLIHTGDKVYLTGNPALDRIKQTPLLTREQTLCTVLPQAEIWRKVALVCVHPNTVGNNPMLDADAVYQAMMSLREMAFVCIGANADPGGDMINLRWRGMARDYPFVSYSAHVSPQVYYSLMKHCDVMVGNSSAMLTEAPMFGLPCVLVGDRQKGRLIPNNIVSHAETSDGVVQGIASAIAMGRLQSKNPYGDGNSAPRVVKALEENAWRWNRGGKDEGK